MTQAARSQPATTGSPPRSGDPRIELAGLFLEAHRGLMARLADVHGRHGLQGTEFTCLLRLSRSPRQQLRMSDLAAQTGTSTSGITSVVDRLLAAGLVTREASPEDRRSLLVRLTDDGAARLAADLEDLVEVLEECVEAPIGPDRDAVARALRNVRDVVAPQAGQVT
ncbi:MAG: MarR family transcriptional regulator [bacterium]|nr:MarR family transcriptional regulator [bacterium]